MITDAGGTGLFFFFKQKTAYEIKECDWSSDVCSSDLIPARSEIIGDRGDGRNPGCGQLLETGRLIRLSRSSPRRISVRKD